MFRILALFSLVLAAPVSAVERVEIVLDASTAMWTRLGDGPPLFVAVRETLQDYAAASAQRQGRPEVALRVAGGGVPLGNDDWCGDTRLVATFGILNSQGSREALEDLLPRGGRPLARALEEAADDLADVQDRRRIVIITSGSDQCHENLIEIIAAVMASDPPIEVRIIGLGLDQSLANAATQLAPTRNLADTAGLRDAMEWALQPPDTRPAVAGQIDIRLSLGGTPLVSSAIELTDATGSERAFSAVEDGRARVQLTPGRYRASIKMDDRPAIEISGLVVEGTGQEIDILLSDTPPVTLEVDPEQPLAGGSAHVGYWGAPSGRTWISLALPNSVLGAYLARTNAPEGRGEVTLDIPDSLTELEARFIIEPLPGVYQLLGSLPLNILKPTARLESPDQVENGKPFEISWTGPGHAGDNITIAEEGADAADHAVCLPVSEESGGMSTLSPTDIGDYVISYRTARGTILDRRSLEVFEVLATLDGPAAVAPTARLVIAWTGPDAEQDFLSIAPPETPGDEYIRWIPTSEGNPAQLSAPPDPGMFEVRYIRSLDDAILARHPFEVVEPVLELHVPKSVAAGTRFDVRWTGTARSGDFLTVAEVGSNARDSLDFSYASSGSPLRLAAPFEPGDYEVRYVSGSSFEVVLVVPLTVR